MIWWIGILAAICPLVTALLVARLERVRYQTQKLREDLNSAKKDFYFDLIKTLQKLFDGEWDEIAEGSTGIDKMKELLKKAYYYSSSDVLKSLGDLLQLFYVTDDNAQQDESFILNSKQHLAELIVQIRRDLGHSPWPSSENWYDILRLNVKDIQSYVPKAYRHDRGPKTYPKFVLQKRD